MKKIMPIVLIVIVIILIICIIYSGRTLEVDQYKMYSLKLPEEFKGYRILQLSDLHSKQIGKENEKLIAKIEEINPDIIVMTGDMMDIRDKNYDVLFALCEKLTSKYPVYYIFGNHEQSIDTNKVSSFVNELKNRGITVLNNEKITLTKDVQSINMYGLLPDKKMYRQNIWQEQDMLNKFGELDDSKFNILLSHNPIFFDVYAKWGADLILAGHIHGGNVRIPFIGGIFSPDISLFPKYSKGMYQSNSSTMVVSAGLSEGTLKIRLFNPLHLAIIELDK